MSVSSPELEIDRGGRAFPRKALSRKALLVACVVLASGLMGCAAGSHCRIIPAQLELARMSRDKAQTTYLSLKDDVDRLKSNNEVSLEREASLTRERDELKALVDSLGAGREKKEEAK